MHHKLSLIAVAILVCTPNLSAAEPANPLDKLRKEHPRLLFTAADQDRIEELAKSEELLARLIWQNRVNAEGMLGGNRVRYEIPDGKRLLRQSRYCIERVAAMSMAYRLSGDRKFAESAIEEMLTAAKFKDWNPSHFLDTAEMTTALAIGYDWLHDVIEPADREKIRRAIVELGLKPGIKVYESRGWWTRRDNNWNQVCNGGLLLGALAVAEDERELAEQVFDCAINSIPVGLSVYKPDGAYPEGPGYWNYGTSYTALTVMGLKSALGTDGGIPQAPGMDGTGDFRIQTLGPTGLNFNFADGGSTSAPSATMFALSQVRNKPLWAWWHRRQLDAVIPSERKAAPKRCSRFFPMEIAWYDRRGSEPTANELPKSAKFGGIQDIVTMRNAWDDPHALFVGFKGGNNLASHGHLDIGSFVLDADGVRWAVDLGGDNYNMPGYFGGRRWHYYRLTNLGHNTLVIDGKLQNPEATAKVVEFNSTPRRVRAVVDMTEAYKGQATSAKRTVEMLDTGKVRILDEIDGPSGEVRWGMVTAADVQLDGGKATLSQDGKKLSTRILSPLSAKFEIVSTNPPTAIEKQNEGTRMLAIKAKPDAGGKLRIEVEFLQPAKQPRG